jgi:hypothetical protein
MRIESGNAVATTVASTSSPTTTAAVNTAEASTTTNLPAGLPATTTASKSGVNGMKAEGVSSTVLNLILLLAFASGFMVAFV